jgi:hypothetical protein
MAPAIYFALVLLFVPTVILAEPVHIPIARRRPVKSKNWNREANSIRKRYGYSTTIAPLSGRQAAAQIPVLDQVHIFFIDMIYIISSQHIDRV